jgi:protein phosphatase
LYRLRAKRLEQLTHDHTWVQEQVDAGALTPDQARGHPYANVLTRALGTQDSIEIETAELDVALNDLYLVCSDGLTGMLNDEAIAEIVVPAGPLDHTALRLITAAKQRGGFDNITVLLVRIVE